MGTMNLTGLDAYITGSKVETCSDCGSTFTQADGGCGECFDDIESMKDNMEETIRELDSYDELEELSLVIERHLRPCVEDFSDLEALEVLELEVDERIGVQFSETFTHPAFGSVTAFFWRHWNNFIDLNSVVMNAGHARHPIWHDKMSREERTRLKSMLISLVKA